MNNGQNIQPHPRLLIIDDNAAIHEDFRKILGGQSSAGSQLSEAERALFGESPAAIERVTFRMDSAYQGQEALKMVEEAARQNDPYALAFVDVRMPPGWDGIETLEHIWKVCPDLQAIICTAYSDYSWDDLIRRFGQKDNLLILKKPFETAEVLQAAHAMARKWELAMQARLRLEDLDRMVCERTQELQLEIEERAKVQEALRVSEERFSKAFRASPLPMAIKSLPDGRYLDANENLLALAGLTQDQLMGRTDDELILWEDAASPKTAAAQSGNRVRNHPLVLRRSDGTIRNTLLWTEPITLNSSPCLLVIVEDVTSRMKLEAQLRQSQKLELVGRLTASVAHEFNNLLTVIQGHASLLRDNPANAKFAADAAERIVQASQRASAFTGQLLAFSRKQPVLHLKSVNISEIIQNMRKMFGQLLGENHKLQLDCAPKLPPTRLNEGAIEQILVNLALNARDAMPDGGIIRISTSLEIIDDAAASRHPDARPGRFVCLTVLDSGCGMSKEIVSRIFDPFFTTKEVGKGTGLGLPTVLSIVQQHNGWIEVASQPGHGSTFEVFLPALQQACAADKVELPKVPAVQRGNGETVLVVEDDPNVRELAHLTLEHGGYHVLDAADGQKALQVWESNPETISVLVTDIVMPNGLSGGELAKRLRKKNPSLRVICISGYNPEFIKKDLPAAKDVVFLPKPYDSQSLLNAVKKSLSNNGGNGSPPVNVVKHWNGIFAGTK
ncbi:MAG TPA: response regulator [Verrucomicrobiota bacterium]|nr:response regulator [Verrucomicrobiota bacterium]